MRDPWAITLRELATLVHQAQQDADRVEARYDPTYGFPLSMFIDWHADAVDDEVSYTVSEFLPL